MPLGDAIADAVMSVDDANRAFANAVADVAERAGDASLPALSEGIRVKVDRLISTYYGQNPRAARFSVIFRAIVAAESRGSELVLREQVGNFRALIEREDPETSAALKAAMAGQPDELASVYLDLGSAQTIVQSRMRAGALDPQRRWVDPDGYTLSERVWKRGNKIRMMIDREVASAIRRGEGPITLARSLRTYLSPDFAPVVYGRDGRITQRGGKPPHGGAGTSATRTLARTEMQAVAHQTTVTFVEMLDMPEAGVRWNLSPAHPKLDICDSYARNSSPGFPAGVYLPGSFPKIPHPNCLCNASPWVPSREYVLQYIMARYGL